ncbi:hypothetical protein KIL84_000842 [Mauremys mutica]|uniref:Uncharacterized protein n=1 Tax=Mauremys mutica TaxID=74926 RepID=A0A9D4ANT5_9SAUR|nr:hypothetical protein KIL84_000842 [Mauremys mutica]
MHCGRRNPSLPACFAATSGLIRVLLSVPHCMLGVVVQVALRCAACRDIADHIPEPRPAPPSSTEAGLVYAEGAGIGSHGSPALPRRGRGRRRLRLRPSGGGRG